MTSAISKVVISTGRMSGKATQLAQELSKLPERERERVWMDCPVPLCTGRACLRLSSPYCYKHSLLSSPDLVVSEIMRINRELSAFEDVLSKLNMMVAKGEQCGKRTKRKTKRVRKAR